MLTLTGIVVLLALGVRVWKKGIFGIPLDPYSMICLSYFRFFGLGSSYSEQDLTIDFSILLALGCFSAAFFLANGGCTDFACGTLGVLWPPSRTCQRPAPIPYWGRVVLVLVVVAYVVLNLWVATLQHGSLMKALVRLYSNFDVVYVNPWLLRASKYCYYGALMALLVLRYNHVVFGSGRIALWVSCGLCMFVAFPKGSAGGLVAVVFPLLYGDLLGRLSVGRKLRLSMDTYAIGGTVLVFVFVLMAVRGVRVADPQELWEQVKARANLGGQAVGAVAGAHHVVWQDIGFCLKTFGKEEPFLWFYTPYSILVNPIPRELWPEKPVGFGLRLAEIKYEGRTSVVSLAAGLAGEGYANGGIFGIVLLSFGFGFISGKAAKYALTAFVIPSYPVLATGMLLFGLSGRFVRGGMMSMFCAGFYPLAAWCVLLFLVGRLWTLGGASGASSYRVPLQGGNG